MKDWSKNADRLPGFRQTLKIGGVEYGFCWIPPGEFYKELPETKEGDSTPKEKLRVKIKRGFWLLETPVTQRLYRRIVGENPSQFRDDDRPVERVSYVDALRFCYEMNKKLLPRKKLGVFIPTETEWEYACRAGTTTAYNWGDDWDDARANADVEATDHMNEFFLHNDEIVGETTRIMSYPPNAWGIYDAHGNVWELTRPHARPFPMNGESITQRVVFKGGSFHSRVVNCQSAVAFGLSKDARSAWFGFRIALRQTHVEGFKKTTKSRSKRKRREPSVSKSAASAPLVSAAEWTDSDSREPGFSQILKIREKTPDRLFECFRWIPAGEFDMGSAETEEERNDDETLHHVVLTKGFWMLNTAVSQRFYRVVMGKNPSASPQKDSAEFYTPVDQVSWRDANEFCRKLTALLPEGVKASLPTEAQWEYACRAGTTTPFNFGNVLNGEQANCDGNNPYGTDQKGLFLENTTSSSMYPPNAWNLFGMHGNVWEWTADYYGAYPTGKVVDPQGPPNGKYRVARGGAWLNPAKLCRSASRGAGDPEEQDYHIGFRVILSVSDNSSPNTDKNQEAEQISQLEPSNESPPKKGTAPVRPPLGPSVMRKRDSDSVISSDPIRVVSPTEWREAENRAPGVRKTLEIGDGVYGFRWIPSGEFDMGAPRSETGFEFPCETSRVVLTKGYWMLETPVTQKLYREVLGMESQKIGSSESTSKILGYSSGDDFPAGFVRFFDARMFCMKLTKRLPERMFANLPTEAEWERACRADTSTKFWWGDVWDGSKANALDGGPFRTTRVGTYPPNPWGLSDMLGNVAEWTLDWYERKDWGEYEFLTPTLVDPQGPPSGDRRVTRGGTYESHTWECRSASRKSCALYAKLSFVGFRFLIRYE